MKICFLDKTNFYYNINDLNSPQLRGAEIVLLNLAKSLSKLNHEVFIINNCQKNEKIQNINFVNINKIDTKIDFDLAISNNDNNFFNYVNSGKKILISHSIQNIEKFIRKKQLLAYFKHKPKIALLGKYHFSKRPYLTRVFGYFFLPYGVDDLFLNTILPPTDLIDSNMAIFTSRPDRNLDLLIDLWINEINPNYKKYKLLVTPNKFQYKKNANIFSRKLNSKKEMINDLIKSRMLILPGHKAELFCLAAEEARELCVPIITLGIGSLHERVLNKKTGLIAKNKKEFVSMIIELFRNDELWNSLRSNLLEMRNSKNWDFCAKILINNI